MNNKKIKTIFLIFLFALTVGFILTPQNVFATERPLEIDYPEIAGEKPTTVQETLLPDYIKYLFNFSLIIVGLIAFAALLIGGFLYLISAGNPAALSDAKDRILGALIGLVLLLCSWLILNTINPQLTIFYPIELPEISMYQGQPGSVTLFEDDCSGFADCDDNNPCTVQGTKCFDIFKKQGVSKKCVDETKMINLAVKNNLKRQVYGESDNWDDRANSLILYGENKRVRVCADPDFKECKILTTPNECINISELRDDIPGKGDILGKGGEARLSSLEIMNTPEGARLYEEKNFGGKTYQEFPAGINGYDCKSGSELSRIGENRASSIEVGPGYWTILCREKNGDCGWSGSSIVYDTFPENTGYGDTYLLSFDPTAIPPDPMADNRIANNYVGDNAVSKICVIKFGVCGGVLVKGDEKTDFIPRGERYQLGKDSIVPSNSVTEVYQYMGGCKIKIWENSGTGSQCREPDATGKCDCGPLNVPSGIYDDPDNVYGITCETDDTCDGREWTSDPPKDWDVHGPAPDYANAFLQLSVKLSDPADACKYIGGIGYDCDTPPDGVDDCLTRDSNCTKYKYTFSDLICDYYATGSCCSGPTFANACEECNTINSVDRKASCIQVIE